MDTWKKVTLSESTVLQSLGAFQPPRVHSAMFPEFHIGAGPTPRVSRVAPLEGLPAARALGGQGGRAKFGSWFYSCWLCNCGPVGDLSISFLTYKMGMQSCHEN